MTTFHFGKKPFRFGISLKAINTVLRWTGWRLYIGFDDAWMEDKNLPPKSQIGLIWYGWGDI